MTQDETVARHVRDVDWVRRDAEILGAGGRLPALVEDLLDIASSVFVADRCVRRGAADSAAWSRRMRVEVVVSDPSAWSSEPLRSALADVLTWLTEDDWRLTFTGRPERPRWIAPRLAIDSGEHDVALFSGGLDSVAGAAGHLADGRPLRAVSVWTNERMRGYQSRCGRELLCQHGGALRAPLGPAVADRQAPGRGRHPPEPTAELPRRGMGGRARRRPAGAPGHGERHRRHQPALRPAPSTAA